VQRLRRCSAPARHAEGTHQPLREAAHGRAGDGEGLDPHLHQAREGSGGALPWNRGQDEVPGQPPAWRSPRFRGRGSRPA
jgi:hypothetical protein